MDLHFISKLWPISAKCSRIRDDAKLSPHFQSFAHFDHNKQTLGLVDGLGVVSIAVWIIIWYHHLQFVHVHFGQSTLLQFIHFYWLSYLQILGATTKTWAIFFCERYCGYFLRCFGSKFYLFIKRTYMWMWFSLISFILDKGITRFRFLSKMCPVDTKCITQAFYAYHQKKYKKNVYQVYIFKKNIIWFNFSLKIHIHY